MEVFWRFPAGAPARVLVEARDAAGAPVPFDGAEPLRVEMWDGAALAALPVVPTATHVPGSPGSVAVSVSAVQSAALPVGIRRLRLSVLTAGDWWPILDGAVEVEDSPGADAPESVYSSLRDLREVAAWTVGTSARGDATDYLPQRAAARAWLDDAILSRIRYSTIRPDLVRIVTAWSPADGPDPWFLGKLAVGALVVDRAIRRTCSLQAAALIAESRVGVDNRASDPWPARAAALRDDARRALLTLRVGLDLDADGKADFFLHMGRVTLR